MSEPLAFASVCAGVISLSGTILSSSVTLSDATELLQARWEMNVRRLKPYNLPKFLHPLLLPITDTLTTLESNVLLASDNDLLDYRTRRMAGCSMTGVAAALVAQVTNSSLQQEYIPTIHWIVPALWTSTLVLALLSAYYSFLLHHYLGGFACAGDLRMAFTHRGLTRDRAEEEEEEGILPSLTAAVKIWAPTYLLALSIGCYIGTIGVYWGVAWGMDLQGRGADSRNVFIFFIATTTLAVALFTVPNTVGKALEDFANLRGYREGWLVHGHYGVHRRKGVAGSSGNREEEKEEGFKSSSTIPEPPKARVRDLESFGAATVKGEWMGGVDRDLLVQAAEAHQRAAVASANVAREMERVVGVGVGVKRKEEEDRREACEGFVI
ncbi:hypothetical protein L873DRAFT_1815492 [Choiromyces venosus 120613-1]|uniref:Uncharacterized protein n=1 Tax=Choiromyces venosus 120613-1 TaxID=1336337 RepID=A0A3N4JAS9_9PEZI|nr:hypothetical protein L873DRAFT_1815492 [Choiromyces venosus 120613-1]